MNRLIPVFRFWFVFVLATPLITGCVTDPDYGQGPLSLSFRVKAMFDEYSRLSNPFAFAVSIDGNYAGWTYCSQGVAGTGCQATPHAAVSYCESASRGIPCKIYAVGRNVVWQGGPVTLHPDIAAAPPQGAPQSSGAISQYTRPIAVQWEGYSDLISGTVTLNENASGGKMAMVLPRSEGDCQGSYTFDNKGGGSWAASCTNGLAASGDFEGFGNNKGSVGKGTDSKGRAVKFTIGAGQTQVKPTASNNAAASNIPQLFLDADIQSCLKSCRLGKHDCERHCKCVIDRVSQLSPSNYMGLSNRIRNETMTKDDLQFIGELASKCQ